MYTGEYLLEDDELSSFDKYTLRKIFENPNEKMLGSDAIGPNYLMSLGLVDHLGSGRYGLTEEGIENLPSPKEECPIEEPILI